MAKGFLTALMVLGVFLGATGCNKSRRTTVNQVAPVATYSVVYVDTFSEGDRIELRDSIAAILSAIKLDNPSVMFNFTFNITKLHINNHPKGRNILVTSGSYNECPELYDRLCQLLLPNYALDAAEHKAKGKQVEADNKRRNKH
jgi:hypothetical protein